MSKEFVKTAIGVIGGDRSLEVCAGELERLRGQEKEMKSHPGPDLCPFEDSAQGMNGHRCWAV